MGGDRQGVARPALPALRLTGAGAAPGPGISPFLHSFLVRMKPSLVRCCCCLPHTALVVPAWAPSRPGSTGVSLQHPKAARQALHHCWERDARAVFLSGISPGRYHQIFCDLYVRFLSCFLERHFLFKVIVPELPAAAHTLRSKAPWLQPHLRTDRDLTLWLSN